MFFLENSSLWIETLVLILGPVIVSESAEVDPIIKDIAWSVVSKTFSPDNNLCYKELADVAWGVFGLEEWALAMLDAAGKPDSNILGGNVGWPGNYAECIGIKNGSMEGQHCWIKLIIEKMDEKFGLPSDRICLIGICVPNSCRSKDFQLITNFTKKIGNTISSLLPFNVTPAVAIECDYNHVEMDVTSITAIVIFCILLFFVFLGTFVDIRCNKTLHSKESESCDENVIKSRSKKLLSAFNNVFLTHFSLYSNGKKLFRLENGSATTFGAELNALKVIAMAGIILIHSFNFLFAISKNLMEMAREMTIEQGSWLYQLLLQLYITDVFFLIMGFLTLHGVVRKLPLEANQIKKFFFSFVVHRYLKLLIVPIIIVFLFQNGPINYLITGPFSPNAMNIMCSNLWWQKVLFISNWCSANDCFLFWWFLSVSMQLHVLSLIIIIPLVYKKHRMCMVNGSAMLIMSGSWVAWKHYTSNILQLYPLEYPDKASFFDSIYLNTFYHLGPYLMGMGLAWALVKHKNQLSLPKKQVFVGWILSIISIFLALYGLYLKPNRMWKCIHSACANNTYCLFFAFIILICNTKNKGIVGRVLHWKYWLPLSKLGFTVYLIHIRIIEYIYYSELDKITFSWPLLFALFLRHWIVAYLIAIIVVLIVEMPLSAILDSILKAL